MPILWRISNFEDLDGIGGLYASGRWHSRGNQIVYLAEHPALALLEVMAGLEIDLDDLPNDFKLLKVQVPEHDISSSHVFQLKSDWNHSEKETQELGNDWLANKQPLLAKVPSAILPESSNFLYNPRHPDAQNTKVIEVITFPFDQRLVT
ncbi:RES family NAD+ phosphorylase [Vibrio hippocampi]|uniref:RES domain-containing protein n=1 Tax=Vibrio hippocampi TaxID=654686 RepID=A0ABM8ZHR0_9VIBR|nr:RES family NAD+ phosphorylase [Vibrio hippocampi]CAH0526199.1 hypothetical protein VHP8226_01673 [Vibrio hippocampi]